LEETMAKVTVREHRKSGLSGESKSKAMPD